MVKSVSEDTRRAGCPMEQVLRLQQDIVSARPARLLSKRTLQYKNIQALNKLKRYELNLKLIKSILV